MPHLRAFLREAGFLDDVWKAVQPLGKTWLIKMGDRRELDREIHASPFSLLWTGPACGCSFYSGGSPDGQLLCLLSTLGEVLAIKVKLRKIVLHLSFPTYLFTTTDLGWHPSIKMSSILTLASGFAFYRTLIQTIFFSISQVILPNSQNWKILLLRKTWTPISSRISHMNKVFLNIISFH